MFIVVRAVVVVAAAAFNITICEWLLCVSGSFKLWLEREYFVAHGCMQQADRSRHATAAMAAETNSCVALVALN